MLVLSLTHTLPRGTFSEISSTGANVFHHEHDSKLLPPFVISPAIHPLAYDPERHLTYTLQSKECTPLYTACCLASNTLQAATQIQIISRLFEARAQIACADSPASSPSKESSTDLPPPLMAPVHNLQMFSPSGNTPLMAAAYYGNIDALKILLRFESDPQCNVHARNYFGWSALHFAGIPYPFTLCCKRHNLLHFIV